MGTVARTGHGSVQPRVQWRTRALIALATLAATFAAAGDAMAVRFSASGDFGTEGTNYVRIGPVLDQIAASGSAFHLALGDLSYGSSTSEAAWCTSVTSRVGPLFPFQLIAGNHDSGWVKTTSPLTYDPHIDDFAKCLPNRMPGLVGTYGHRWYVDVPQADPVVRIVMATPGIHFRNPATGAKTWDTYQVGTPGYTWVAEAIDGARAAKIPWVVAGVHYPCLSLGAYDCEPEWSMGADLMALLVDKRVDLVLSGHEHNYARTHQLATDPDCPTIPWVPVGTAGAIDPDCVATTTASMTRGEGTVFAIVGTGGRRLANIDLADAELGYFATWSGANVDPSVGNLMLDVTAGRISAEFTPAEGTFTDAFTITDPTAPPGPDDDADGDGVHGASDLCPKRAGPASRQGCPLRIVGTAAAETLTGSPLRDLISAAGGGDTAYGRGGDDRVAGGDGGDRLYGGIGNDTVIGGPGRDRLLGGAGNDLLKAVDGVRDVLTCGPGNDTAIVDRFDVMTGCEHVIRR